VVKKVCSFFIDNNKRLHKIPKQTQAHYVTGELRFAFYLIQDELADKVEENGRHNAGEKR